MLNQQKFLITGATGKTGGYAIKELLNRGAQVRALVHKIDERSKKLEDSGVEVIAGDLTDFNAMSQAVKGVSGVYFVYPIKTPGILAATSYIIQAAREEGVESIVNMSQISARREAKSHAAQDHWVAERMLDLSGLKITHIRPTFFAEWLIYFDNIKTENKIVLPFGEGRYAPIAAEDLGAVITELLLNPDAHAGKSYPLYGPVEYNLFEIADILSDVLGRDIQYDAISMEMFKAFTPEQGYHPHVVQHITNVSQDCRDGVFAGVNSAVRDITGKEPMGMIEFIEKHRSNFE